MTHSHDILGDLSWARRFARACAANLPTYLDRDDLQSAGIVAFLGAATRYDNSKGASFRGFCATRIRGAILDEVRRWAWAPRSVHRNHRLIDSATRTLMGELNREPTALELGIKLGITEDAVLEMLDSSQLRQVVPWDEVSENSTGEEGIHLSERIADVNCARPDAGLLSMENRRELIICMEKLTRIQALVIVLHYLKDVPLCEVAKMTGVTPSRISQIHHQALNRLRAFWNSRS